MTGQKGVFGTNMCKLLIDPSIINKKLVNNDIGIIPPEQKMITLNEYENLIK